MCITKYHFRQSCTESVQKTSLLADLRRRDELYIQQNVKTTASKAGSFLVSQLLAI